MLIISSGMPKSASSFVFNLINDLLISAGYKDTRKIMKRYRLNHLLNEDGGYFLHLYLKSVICLFFISIIEGKYVIKTHTKFRSFWNFFLRLQLMKVIYIYRDPRDVLISAVDHGKRSLESGENSPFEEFVEFEDALFFVKKRINIFKTYDGNRNVLRIKYEDLISDKENIVKNICRYLQIDLTEEQIVSVLNKYDTNNPDFDKKSINFNKGEVGRYKKVLTKNQLNQINQEIGKDIELMGYSLDE